MYVDGFILAVEKDKLDVYRAMARIGRETWMKFGAQSYVEALADDVPCGELTSFPHAVQATDDEIVVFSYITYRDRAHRDEVNAKMMAELQRDENNIPFDAKRMIFGGFVPFEVA